MQIISSIKIPTPFGGTISTPPLETPPLKLPTMPDARARKAIGHGIGEDLAEVVGAIPFAGSFIEDSLQDMHFAEIKKILTPDEYSKFSEYNKAFPSAIALARIFAFKEV